MDSCIGKNYEEIWQIFSKKHGDTAQNRQIHLKWKEIVASLKVGK